MGIPPKPTSQIVLKNSVEKLCCAPQKILLSIARALPASNANCKLACKTNTRKGRNEAASPADDTGIIRRVVGIKTRM